MLKWLNYFPHSIHSWQVDNINEPPAEPLPVRESILTKAGFIVATGSVESRNEVNRGPRTVALSSCLLLSVSLSLLPSVTLSLSAHTMCPLDCHLQSDPEDQDQPRISMHVTHQHTPSKEDTKHTHPRSLNGKMHRPRPHASQISLSRNQRQCIRVCVACDEKEGGRRRKKGLKYLAIQI